jgi:Lysine methyltransferase
MEVTTTVVTSSPPCHDGDDKGNSNSNSNKLPSSPAARAFFAALDDVGGAGGTRKTKQTTTTTSDFVTKRIQTLGWRNRYSQQEQYPVSISISSIKTAAAAAAAAATDDDDDDAQTGDSSTRTSYSFSVRQVQRGELEGTYGTGATVWPAAMVLVKYLERHATTLLYNKRVVDLGTGTGLTSIAAALLGARRVVCTDGEAPVVQLARDNIAQVVVRIDAAAAKDTTSVGDGKEKSVEDATKADGSHFVLKGCPIDVQEYWWGTGTIKNGMNEEKDDINMGDDLVVLVSDCVLPKLYPIAPLVDALDQLLPSSSAAASSSSSSSMAILSYEHRHYADYDPRDKFRQLAAAKNLHVSVVDMEQQDPVYSVDDIEIWHVTRF